MRIARLMSLLLTIFGTFSAAGAEISPDPIELSRRIQCIVGIGGGLGWDFHMNAPKRESSSVHVIEHEGYKIEVQVSNTSHYFHLQALLKKIKNNGTTFTVGEGIHVVMRYEMSRKLKGTPPGTDASLDLLTNFPNVERNNSPNDIHDEFKNKSVLTDSVTVHCFGDYRFRQTRQLPPVDPAQPSAAASAE